MVDEYVVQEQLASIEYALLCYDYGKLDDFLKTGNREATEDYINCYYGAIEVATDFFESCYYEASNETKFYFSYRAMVEYYRLCRIHSSKHGLRLRDDPYMLDALRFVQQMFDFGYTGGYSVHLQTKINHEWASGLVIHLDDSYFTAEYELAEALLEIGAWYERNCMLLRETLLMERAIWLPALPPHHAEGGKSEQ